MRIAFILFFILTFSNSLLSQNNFAKQLQQVINDTANHFQKIRGTFKKKNDTTLKVYNSLIKIDSTKENRIILGPDACIYQIIIADSVTKIIGERFFKGWKSKLMSALGQRQINKESQPKSEDQIAEGWSHDKESLSVSINLWPEPGSKSLYFVILSITKWH